MFSVHRDASRPFRVHAGNAVVQAIGTQFNVYRRAQSTTVLVVEGVVQISEPAEPTVPLSLAPLRIEAGEQAEVASSGAVVKHAAADVDKAVAWRARRLVFRSETLENVAGEFNRYNDVKVRVEGSVRSRRLIGTFNADDPESLVQFLTGDEEILIERERDVFVIRAKD